jgi:hypothetical protein
MTHEDNVKAAQALVDAIGSLQGKSEEEGMPIVIALADVLICLAVSPTELTWPHPTAFSENWLETLATS